MLPMARGLIETKCILDGGVKPELLAAAAVLVQVNHHPLGGLVE